MTLFENLCLSCYRCNEFKGTATHSAENRIRLFHPRRDLWDEHFRWSLDGTHIVGLTEIGIATVTQLNMNNGVVVAARRRWVSAGWHPPD